MKISDELRAFIESDYKGMVSYEDREREEKKLHKTAKGTRKKQLSRGLKKDLDILGLAKKKKWLSDNQYQIEKNKLLDEAEQKKLNHRNEDKEHIKPFGKTHYGFNNFVCLCWYLIKKETDKPESNIFMWISNFLSENNFRKQNNKQYKENDLKQIIYNHNYGKESSGKSYIQSYFDFMYSEFTQR
jgi:hypothetical protein